MSVIVLALAGFVVGFALDETVARLSREPFEHRHEVQTHEGEEPHPEHGISLDLNSEAGTVVLPWSLTGGASYRRIIVVALTVVLFALVGRQYAGHPLDMTIVAAYVAALLVCAATDIIAYRVPNAISYPAIVGALLIGMLMPGASRLEVAAGGLLAGGIFLVCALLPGAPMGIGDVKLACFIGFALGLIYVVQAMLIMAISGGAVAAVLLVKQRMGRRDVSYMFYAPFISFGAIVILLVNGTAFRAI